MKVRSAILSLLWVLLLTAQVVSAESVSNRSGTASLDLQGLHEGSVTALYEGEAEEARVQVISPEGQATPYALHPGEETVLALGYGEGSYRFNFLEKAGSEQFAVIFSYELDFETDSEISACLKPNAYVKYHEGSKCVEAARGLYEAVNGDTGAFIKAVYDYVISNIAYDEDLAADVPYGYVPDPDATIQSGKGICLDYASLMTAMLRCCGVPARMVAGNFGPYYHAWVLVSETVPEDGKLSSAPWRTYDPTLGASNSASAVQERLNRKTDYIAKYVY